MKRVRDTCDVVAINVGGRIFMTRKKTLCVEEKSLLAQIFFSDGEDTEIEPFCTDDHGRWFFDRDPDTFEVILNALRRGGKLVGISTCTPDFVHQLRDDAEFFGLAELVSEIDAYATHNHTLWHASSRMMALVSAEITAHREAKLLLDYVKGTQDTRIGGASDAAEHQTHQISLPEADNQAFSTADDPCRSNSSNGRGVALSRHRRPYTQQHLRPLTMDQSGSRSSSSSGSSSGSGHSLSGSSMDSPADSSSSSSSSRGGAVERKGAPDAPPDEPTTTIDEEEEAASSSADREEKVSERDSSNAASSSSPPSGAAHAMQETPSSEESSSPKSAVWGGPPLKKPKREKVE
eukprot:CAMPEP_0185748220 /NCGR_PEP_ID=MMETSP1174-20130828/6885_1 /TAXON_ID=35687 /ORGANISM="Dictyocha speculum, Strain CCMP1381" /LENGTH=348 /DNA_ID=CAMNT_0028423767 /DNA_START=91 /DNA_END=1137 /DNA_ORIENTATION=+